MKVNTDIQTISADGRTIYRYHTVDIVTQTAEGIILNCQGFMTHETKKRMNIVGLKLGFHLRLLNNAWIVQFDNRSIPYVNGMILRKGKSNG
jgi:hypothetical protein